MSHDLSSLLMQEADARVDCREHVSVLLGFNVTRLIVTVEQTLAISSVLGVQEEMRDSSIVLQEYAKLVVYIDGPMYT